MKKRIHFVLSIILGIAAISLLIFLAVRFVAIQRGSAKLSQLEDEVKASDSSTQNRDIKIASQDSLSENTLESYDPKESSDSTDTSAYEVKKDPYISPIDFDHLTEINPDIYAWLEIPNMNISYPVLQREGVDQYYLIYSFDGIRDGNGSIYTHDENARDFNDFNTIIYGHNLVQGGMFTDLEMYYDETFRKEHNKIIIYTPEKELHYSLYGVVIYNDYLIDYLFDFDIDQGKMAYVDSLSESNDSRTYVDTEREITVDDHLITLSTCVSRSNGEQRLLIVAVLDEVID